MDLCMKFIQWILLHSQKVTRRKYFSFNLLRHIKHTATSIKELMQLLGRVNRYRCTTKKFDSSIFNVQAAISKYII